MTDQEAKNIIVGLAFNEQRIEDSREVEALRKGVIAINEAQAYREIGTVKEFKYLKEKSVPAAYPVEKVVSEIQKKYCQRCRNILSVPRAEEYCKSQNCRIYGICEIVRKGGVE